MNAVARSPIDHFSERPIQVTYPPGSSMLRPTHEHILEPVDKIDMLPRTLYGHGWMRLYWSRSSCVREIRTIKGVSPQTFPFPLLIIAAPQNLGSENKTYKPPFDALPLTDSPIFTIWRESVAHPSIFRKWTRRCSPL